MGTPLQLAGFIKSAGAAPPPAHFWSTYGTALLGVDINTASLWQDTAATIAATDVGHVIQRVDGEIGGFNWQEAVNPGNIQTPATFGSKKVLSNTNAGIYVINAARSALTAGTVALVLRLTDGTTSVGNNALFWSGGGNTDGVRYRTQTAQNFVQWQRNQAGGFEDIDKDSDWLLNFPVFVLVVRWQSASVAFAHYRVAGGTNQGPFPVAGFDPDDTLTTNTGFRPQADQTQWAGWALYNADIGATQTGNLLTDAIARWT